MEKVTAAIITQNENVLLMRRDKNQPFAGWWEFPGGKVEDGEKLKQCLKRELSEELSIDATIGNMIDSVKMPTFEIFAYKILKYEGDIQLNVHDALKWVPIWDLQKHDMLPADKIIAKKLCSGSEEDLEAKAYVFALNHMKMPHYDDLAKLLVVTILKNNKKETSRFLNKEDANKFYVNYLHTMVNAYKRNKAMITIQKIRG